MSRTDGLLSIGFKGNRRNWRTPFLGRKKKRFSKVLFRLVLLLIQLLVYSLGNLLNYIRLFLLVSPKKVGKSAYYIILFLGLIRVTDLARLIFTAALIADLQVLRETVSCF